MVTRDQAMNSLVPGHAPSHSARLPGLQILALVFPSCVTLGKLQNTSEGLFPKWYEDNADNDTAFIILSS